MYSELTDAQLNILATDADDIRVLADGGVVIIGHDKEGFSTFTRLNASVVQAAEAMLAAKAPVKHYYQVELGGKDRHYTYWSAQADIPAGAFVDVPVTYNSGHEDTAVGIVVSHVDHVAYDGAVKEIMDVRP